MIVYQLEMTVNSVEMPNYGDNNQRCRDANQPGRDDSLSIGDDIQPSGDTKLWI
jgi:hypothetical protein